MAIIKLKESMCEDNMSLDDLWISLSDLCEHIRCDNLEINDGDYPLHIRSIQLSSIKSLINEIEKYHNSN